MIPWFFSSNLAKMCISLSRNTIDVYTSYIPEINANFEILVKKIWEVKKKQIATVCDLLVFKGVYLLNMPLIDYKQLYNDVIIHTM